MADKDERHAEAVDTIARWLAWHSLDASLQVMEKRPLVGQYDSVEVIQRLRQIAESIAPTAPQADAAFDFMRREGKPVIL